MQQIVHEPGVFHETVGNAQRLFHIRRQLALVFRFHARDPLFDVPHPSSKEGKRVLEPIAKAATWSADIPSNTSAPVVLLGATPVKYVALAAAWSPGAISPLR